MNRDAVDISGLQRLADLPRLLRFIAARSGSGMVWSSLAGDAGIPRTTLDPYVRLLETPDGRVVGIEVKAAATVQAKDLTGLALLRDKLSDRFVGGYVLHTGPSVRMVADRVTAVPIDALWHDANSSAN